MAHVSLFNWKQKTPISLNCYLIKHSKQSTETDENSTRMYLCSKFIFNNSNKNNNYYYYYKVMQNFASILHSCRAGQQTSRFYGTHRFFGIYKSHLLAYIQSTLSPILQPHKLFVYNRKISQKMIQLHNTRTLSHLKFRSANS
jgi:hypothetical protein